MIEQPQAKLAISPLLPSIEQHHLIHVPQMEESITLITVETLPASQNREQAIGDHAKIHEPNPPSSVPEEGTYAHSTVTLRRRPRRSQ